MQMSKKNCLHVKQMSCLQFFFFSAEISSKQKRFGFNVFFFVRIQFIQSGFNNIFYILRNHVFFNYKASSLMNVL